MNTYKKRKEFLICVDSDGSAMDTMEPKHRLCFAPLFADEFGFVENRQEIIAAVSAVVAEELGTDISAIRILSFKKI